MEPEVTSSGPGSSKRNRQGLWDFAKSIELLGDEYLVEKAPFQLPISVKEFIVKVAPYVICIQILLMLPLLLAVLGLGGIMTLTNPFLGPLVVLSTAVMILQFCMYVLAIRPLSKRQVKGWDYVFYGQIMGFLATVFNGSIVAAIIGGLIGFYFLFQVKQYYRS